MDDMISLTRDQLSDLIEKAVERGTSEALKKIGLDDEDAGKDIRELRDFFSAWRLAKKTAFEAIVKWMVLGVMGVMIAAVILYTKVHILSGISK